MTTVTVTNRETRPDGTAKKAGRVVVGIVNVGWNGDGSIVVDVTHPQLTDSDGNVSFDLQPSPAGTWYVWNHSDGINQSVFLVPSSGGPYTLQARLVTQPSGNVDLAVSQAALDAAIAGLAGDYVAQSDVADYVFDAGTVE